MRVRQTARTVEVVQERQGASGRVRRDSVAYTLGGPPVVSGDPLTTGSTVSAALEGAQLVITGVMFTQDGRTAHYTNRWALAPDGRVLTVTSSGGGPGGEWTARDVFVRP